MAARTGVDAHTQGGLKVGEEKVKHGDAESSKQRAERGGGREQRSRSTDKQRAKSKRRADSKEHPTETEKQRTASKAEKTESRKRREHRQDIA